MRMFICCHCIAAFTLVFSVPLECWLWCLPCVLMVVCDFQFLIDMVFIAALAD